MEYGLIGAKLGHSYSKIIHEMLCGYHYDLCPLPTEEEARAFLAKRQFKAINVTIPYKKLVMEYCSYIDPRAKAIGAVNTVVNKNGLLYGYNTDYMGFAHLCDAHGVNFAGKTVVILGTGGTGFGFAGMRGSEANDAFHMTPEGAVVTATNHNAGINGGIANGMPVVFRTVVKPTPSIYKQQDTVDYLAKKDAQLSIQGRHDPCIVPRAAIVQTCAAALAVGDLAFSLLFERAPQQDEKGR